MFALLAAICFLLALLSVSILNINMVTLGLLFVAVHLWLGGIVWGATMRR